MCKCFEKRTVWLHAGGRTFTCPFCKRVRQHPPFDLTYLVLGHAYCDFCGSWMKIEGVWAAKAAEDSGPEREAARRGLVGRGLALVAVGARVYNFGVPAKS